MLEEMIPRLPRKESSIKKAFESCKSRGRFVPVDSKKFSAHLEKAKSDLAKISYEMDHRAWDWVIVKSYYSMHHALNALLVKFQGIYSKDHYCAILAIKEKELITEDIYKEFRKIDSQFSDFTGFDVTYTLRKIGQYDVKEWKGITERDAQAVYSIAKRIVEYAEERCYS